MKKLLKLTSCRNCGNRVRITRVSTSEKFKIPMDCSTCRTLGKEEAVRQSIIAHSSGRSKIASNS
jgi:hypothetical protein